jgi:hypothetical protein
MTLTAAMIAIIIMATLTQYLTDIVKNLIPAPGLIILKPPLIAAVIGIVIAVIFQVDLFAVLGFATHYALASWIFTGLILSSGSSAIHELISKLRDSRTDTGG